MCTIYYQDYQKKNQYNKTIFNKLKDMSEKEDKYQEIINKFWKNKRKMI